MIGTETASTVSTRGIYFNDKAKGYVSAYDLNYPPWAATAEQWWKVYDARPFLSGGFVWTGFDYRGEPTPYSWPCISSHFGVLDTCGFPKDNYFYYKAWWGAEQVLHLFPHWNWHGKEGELIDVWCYSNLDSVELFVNGKSMGRQQLLHNSHVAWKVPYQPGRIEAQGIKNGAIVLTEKRETTGVAKRLILRADRTSISANGQDTTVVIVEVQDAQGRVVPTADNLVHFNLVGHGQLIGMGNGDPSCHEADKPATPQDGQRSAFNGLCVVLVQASQESGELKLQALATGLDSATLIIQCMHAITSYKLA